ncbi:serine/threonine-protein kinase [Streptomyces sp. GC420]|uniref:serine/threonine-protein kinase n=1 Tax=Streptomyces sp. GC420 TaxID=2697568 RepID=UPI0014150116|nr:serine/threonine-protein kinase [Streptomyces sp. GC420]NBM21008.1 protein kinase [Streptomyces sp. GC420]
MNAWSVPGYTGTRELGAGASGRVVLAVHEDTGVPVAVKYLSESLLTRPGFVHDFRAEARLLAGLDSAHVTGLYEYVESPDGAAIVMELVEGLALRALLSREGPIGPEAALVVLKGSLLGLADAHRVGVVHRDYKPENVLVTADGTSKLVDFGIAAGDGTSAGIAGTPAYMAPEQWSGAPASPAADVYAATATFFECLTGRKPYTGENFAELALQHVDAPVPVDKVPEPVRPLVLRGLAKTPEERPENAEAFVGELEQIAGGAYGPDWEENGRGRLAALVALLPLLLPSAGDTPQTTTDTATTMLDQGGGWVRSFRPSRSALLASAAALGLAFVLAYGVEPGNAGSTQQAGKALATTSAQPGVSSGPTGTAEPSGSASSSASPGASPSPSESGATAGPSDEATATATDGGDGDTPGGTTATPTYTATPTTEPTTATPTPPSAPNVKDITVSGFQQTGSTTATATVDVVTDGTGPVSITVGWYVSDAYGRLGTLDGTQTFQRSGATQYTFTADHTFQGLGCYWAVQVTSDPASADGGASQQLLTRRCILR